MGLREAEREVAGMVHSGTPFDAIEDGIQVMPGLLDDERSGLWLYAWSRQSSVWQRNVSSKLLLWLANGVDSESAATRDEKPPISP
jgi:rhamnogalacturonyl hydrolase YesR